MTMKEIRNSNNEITPIKPESRTVVNGVIYLYISPSHKYYIGQTIQEKARKNQHKNRIYHTAFSNAIQKYGYENFEYKVLFRTSSKCLKKMKVILDTLEKYYIKRYKSNNPEFGYNLTEGGEGSLGYKHTAEAKIKMSNFQKGKTPWNLGVAMSEAQKQKLRLVNRDYEKGANNCRAKAVIKYDLDKNVVARYDTLTDAAASIGKRASAIYYALNNGTIYNNYYWQYDERNQKQQ